MKRLGQLLLSSLFVLALGGVCLATDVPKLTGVFNDESHIISAAKRDEITVFLKEQEARTSNQIVVLVVPTIAPDTNIAEYGGNVLNAWKLGQADKDNGVLVTFARREGKMRITVGNGLQGALPDLRADELLNSEEIQTFLKQTKFGSAILATVKAIDRAVGGEYQAEPKPAPASDTTPIQVVEKGGSEGSHAFGFFLLLIFVIGVGVVVYFMFRPRSVEGEFEPSPTPSPAPPQRDYYSRFRRTRESSSRPSRRRYDDDGDGFLTGVVVGSALSHSHDSDSGRSSSSRDDSSSDSGSSSSSSSSDDSYSGGGGGTDWGGSGTSFGGGDGSGAD